MPVAPVAQIMHFSFSRASDHHCRHGKTLSPSSCECVHRSNSPPETNHFSCSLLNKSFRSLGRTYSTPAPRAGETVELLEAETLDFIPPALWPPNNSHSSPVDYKMCSVIQENVYQHRIKNIRKL